MRLYHEYIFDEIAKMIVDNLEIMYCYKDDSLINVRNYCNQHDHKRYEPLDYRTLISFVYDAIAEIINCDFLYDFRDME